MEEVVITEDKPKVKSVSKDKTFDPERFLVANIKSPAGTTMVIKKVTPHYFRVNFFKQDDRNNVVRDWKIVQSQMIEVAYEGGIAKLLDRTIQPKG
ncbi:MAG: hypothetical protein HC888_02515 [Candidatus Competibacteraceae bacterium]|nr:hypothetical protein [Candidatus Competibacteraceae bacterium]